MASNLFLFRKDDSRVLGYCCCHCRLLCLDGGLVKIHKAGDQADGQPPGSKSKNDAHIGEIVDNDVTQDRHPQNNQNLTAPKSIVWQFRKIFYGYPKPVKYWRDEEQNSDQALFCKHAQEEIVRGVIFVISGHIAHRQQLELAVILVE